MSFVDQNSPWMFRRDEIDLLEEDLDEIYGLHESPDGRIKTMEQAVILEQLETEEQAEAEFAHQIDVKWLFDSSVGKKPWSRSLQQEKMEEDDLVCDTQRSPLYEQLFQVSELVFLHGTHLYECSDNEKEQAFRLRVNAKMVPIKVANAISEEMHDDPMSLAVAKKEYKLALIYIDRILISLAYLSSVGDLHAQGFLSPLTKIRQMLQQHLSRLNNHRSGFSQNYE